MSALRDKVLAALPLHIATPAGPCDCRRCDAIAEALAIIDANEAARDAQECALCGLSKADHRAADINHDWRTGSREPTEEEQDAIMQSLAETRGASAFRGPKPTANGLTVTLPKGSVAAEVYSCYLGAGCASAPPHEHTTVGFTRPKQWRTLCMNCYNDCHKGCDVGQECNCECRVPGSVPSDDRPWGEYAAILNERTLHGDELHRVGYRAIVQAIDRNTAALVDLPAYLREGKS